MRTTLLTAGALLTLAIAPSILLAQGPSDVGRPLPAIVLAPAAVTRSAAPCSYADCALRIERGFWLPPSLMRGAAGQPVANLDVPRSSEVLPLFAGNDSASTYATQFLSAARVNRPLTLGGIVLAAVGLAQPERMNAYTALGASMLVVSIPFQITEERALSRAVWWYNSTVSAGPAQH